MKFLFRLAGSVLLVLSSQVFADNTIEQLGLYPSYGLGYTYTEHPDTAGYVEDENAFAWKLGGGYQFHSNFAVESHYVSLGKTKSQRRSDQAEVTYDADVFVISAKAIHAYNQNAGVFARVGLTRWDLSVDGNTQDIYGTNAQDFDGTSYVYGAGFTVTEDWNDWSLDVEWNRYQLKKYGQSQRVDNIMATISVKF